MNKFLSLDAKGQQMLQLLAQGGSTRMLAKAMGYSEGTMRVYLHNLYKVLGVRNKTEAVIWYLGRHRVPESPPAASAPRGAAPAARAAGGSDESVGDMALREGLYAAMGIMASFVGPYGRVWEVGVRMKGGQIEERTRERVRRSRDLWRAMLRGDFMVAKSLYDEGEAANLAAEAPSDALLLAGLLVIGGYTSAADGLVARLAPRRKGAEGLSLRETNFLRHLREALHAAGDAPVEALCDMASGASVPPVLRHIAKAALFHVYRARRDAARAAATANALWADAEGARQELEAMGVRTLPREAEVPRPTTAPAIAPATAETAAAR